MLLFCKKEVWRLSAGREEQQHSDHWTGHFTYPTVISNLFHFLETGEQVCWSYSAIREDVRACLRGETKCP